MVPCKSDTEHFQISELTHPRLPLLYFHSKNGIMQSGPRQPRRRRRKGGEAATARILGENAERALAGMSLIDFANAPGSRAGRALSQLLFGRPLKSEYLQTVGHLASSLAETPIAPYLGLSVFGESPPRREERLPPVNGADGIVSTPQD